jgi:MerR family transcriptional regulator, light-induced transcriptional regulator
MAPAKAGLPAGVRSPAAISEELLAALLTFGETRADSLLSEAFAIYPVEQVAEEVLAPTLLEIGERWHRDEATVVQEHFATAVLRRRLNVMFHAYDQPAAGPLAITGAAPTEWHDVGILLVSLALRRNGWRVIYLSQNVPTDQLLQEIRRLRPDLVCLSATMREGALELAQVYDGVAALPAPRPRLIFGGRAFNLSPDLRDRFAGAYISANARDLIAALK